MQGLQTIQSTADPERSKSRRDFFSPDDEFSAIIGKTLSIQVAIEKARRYAGCDAAVLITGETGTGKEIFARAIHDAGVRAKLPFVAVNCAALPNDLIENELFGHQAGAFTGAGRAFRGLVAQAESGTLFLDEIESLSMAAQAKLLRFLQEGEYKPLGGAQNCRANVRIVGACNEDLRALGRNGNFRSDLYFRLCVLTLDLPPLRDRREDIPLLANHLIEHHTKMFASKRTTFSPSAITRLVEYDWPGNVRELKNVIHRALVVSTDSVIQVESLNLPVSLFVSCGLSFKEQKAKILGEFERGYLQRTLARSAKNVTHAARFADMDRSSFIRLMRKHKLTRQGIATTNEDTQGI